MRRARKPTTCALTGIRWVSVAAKKRVVAFLMMCPALQRVGQEALAVAARTRRVRARPADDIGWQEHRDALGGLG